MTLESLRQLPPAELSLMASNAYGGKADVDQKARAVLEVWDAIAELRKKL